MSRSKDLREAVKAVQEAIRDEGPGADYHREMMRKHRQEWPTLWRALDRLIRVNQRSAE